MKKILNSRGKLTLAEDDGNPSILGNGKVIKLPDGLTQGECVECG